MEKFTPLGFLLRLVAALLLVLVTFNPSGYSYYHWVANGLPGVNPAAVVVGILLLAAWAVFLTATMRSIGLIGVGIALAFFAALVWMVVSWGWLDPHNSTAMAWIVLVVFAIVLGIGLSWSHMRRRLTGQADVDEVDAR